MFLRAIESASRTPAVTLSDRDGLCVHPEELSLIVERFQKTVHRGRLSLVGHVFELCNHVVEYARILLRLCASRVSVPVSLRASSGLGGFPS